MKRAKILLVLILGMIGSIVLVWVLYKTSDDISQRRNSFIRRYPYQAQKLYETDLKYYSYYYSGHGAGQIYLGNYTTPLYVTIIDTTLSKRRKQKFELSNTKLPFQSFDLIVSPPHFFVVDGIVPCIFKGSIYDWKAELQWHGETLFSHPVLTDNSNFIFRTLQGNGEAAVGIVNPASSKVSINPKLLTKQIDGNFDVDGSPHFDKETGRFVWLYRYRNEYTVTDSKLNILYRNKTIDTISQAQIEVGYVESRGEKKMSKPPLIVNRSSSLHKNLLYVNSGLIGKYEDESMWDQASIIDVYDIEKQTYISSFYVYNVDDKRVRKFFVIDNHLYAFIGTHLVCYKISPSITKNYISK